jgi:hypothetical protein
MSAYETSHIWGTDGRSPSHETVKYGEFRARAHELLSPFDSNASSARKPMLLNDSPSLCSNGGRGFSVLELSAASEMRELS